MDLVFTYLLVLCTQPQWWIRTACITAGWQGSQSMAGLWDQERSHGWRSWSPCSPFHMVVGIPLLDSAQLPFRCYSFIFPMLTSVWIIFFLVLSIKSLQRRNCYSVFLCGSGTVGFSEDLGVDRRSQHFKIGWELRPYVCWDSVPCVHPQGYSSRSHKPLCGRDLGCSSGPWLSEDECRSSVCTGQRKEQRWERCPSQLLIHLCMGTTIRIIITLWVRDRLCAFAVYMYLEGNCRQVPAKCIPRNIFETVIHRLWIPEAV